MPRESHFKQQHIDHCANKLGLVDDFRQLQMIDPAFRQFLSHHSDLSPDRTGGAQVKKDSALPRIGRAQFAPQRLFDALA